MNDDMSKMQLVCIPYAGASSMMYYPWRKYLPDDVEILEIELAGRGKRIDEAFYSSFDAACDDLYEEILPYIQKPYILFGHSMGATLCYELTKKIKLNGKREPEHIFFSGRVPPHDRSDLQMIYDKPDDVFISEILKLGGCSEDMFEDKMIKDLILPILRADYFIVETYCSKEPVPLSCDISVLYGTEDPYTKKNTMESWKNYTTGDCQFYTFTGNHFFIKSHVESMTRLIIKTIENTPTQ